MGAGKAGQVSSPVSGCPVYLTWTFIMNDQTNRIAFIILHYADRTVTDRCVQSILRMDGADRLQIVIIDNDGRLTDGERETLAAHFKQQGEILKDHITVIRCPAGTGFSRANNFGYAFAREQLGADCIVICNNDIEFVQPDFTARLGRSLRRMNCHVLGPNVVHAGSLEPQNPMDERIRTKEEARYTVRMNRAAMKALPVVYPVLKIQMKRQEKKRLQKKRKNIDYYRQPHKHIVPFGACLIFTPLFVEKEERAFEPETQFYYEEYILTERCFRKGYETGYDPMLKVIHESGSATKESLRSGMKKMRFLMENTASACEVYLNDVK